MPPTFLYLLAVGGWLGMAFLIWFASAFLLVLPMTRRVAGPLASAMACTFPAVIALQLAALPPGAVILGVGLLAIRLIDPGNSSVTENPAVIGIGQSVVLAEFALFGAMSLLGFYEGWRAGWLVAKGHRLRDVIAQGPSARLFGRLGGQRRPGR